jgi:radical SAM protein with 4Fe4S-binding SPASM domain
VLKAYNLHRPDGPREHVCYVPFTSLTFSWKGKVLACSYNRAVVVGNYPAQSVREIWFGKELKKLQEHMQHDDLTHGCQHCAYFIERGKLSGLKPYQFDAYHDYRQHPYPRVFEFELSNTCNLECIMCNGFVSSSIRQNRDKLPPLPEPYDDAFVEQLREFVPHLKEMKFYGGEPFLIRSYFGIMDLVMELNPSIKVFVITNGTVLNQRIKDLLERGNFHLAVSIDSLQKENYEYIRKNASFEQVMKNLEWFNSYAHSRQERISFSFTTQRANWHELPDVVNFCNTHDMIFFNSFLKDPQHLSLITLPAAQLSDIYNTLAAFDPPSGSWIERTNRQVYLDYLQYIKPYIAKNDQSEKAGHTIKSDAPLTDSPFADTFLFKLLKK